MKSNLTDSERRGVVAVFEASGLSVPKFAKQYRMGESTLYSWVKKYGDSERPHSEKTKSFAEVRVSPVVKAAPSPSLTQSARIDVIIIVSPNGCKIEVPVTASATVLSAAVKAASSC